MASIIKVDTIQTAAGGTPTAADLGITVTEGVKEAEQFRLSADQTNSGSNAVVTTNWEKVDDSNYATLGSGITQSSGVFTFPQTGYYLVYLSVMFFSNGSDGQNTVTIEVTENNSTYDTVAEASGGAGGTGSVNGGSSMALINVTDVSNVKVRFSTSSFSTNSYLTGNTGSTRTGVTFIRLNDSL